MKIFLIVGIVIIGFIWLACLALCNAAKHADENIEKDYAELTRKEGQKDVSTELLEQAENSSKDN